jgi:CheY-like chemotaxis protein
LPLLGAWEWNEEGRRNENEAARASCSPVVGRPVPGLWYWLMSNGAAVAIVDDDVSVRESLPDLVKQLGCAARVFASAEEFLDSGAVSDVQCLILDIGLPGMSGPELRRELLRRGISTPTIFITGRTDRSIPPDLLKPDSDSYLF